MLAPLATASTIPFNTRPALQLTSLLHVFLACAALLSLFVIGLVVANRKGWLRRFVVASNGAPSGLPIEVRRVQRLSTHTTLFVLAHGADEYLVVESTRHVTISAALAASGKESKT